MQTAITNFFFRTRSSKIRYFSQGSYGIVKLAYNEEDDTHYVSKHFHLLQSLFWIYSMIHIFFGEANVIGGDFFC